MGLRYGNKCRQEKKVYLQIFWQMTQIHILSISTSADLEPLGNPYMNKIYKYIRVYICKTPKRKLNHHNGLTRCLQKAGKLLSTFVFRFRAKDRQRKCDSVLPKEIISFENYNTFMTSFQLCVHCHFRED